eukprot:1951769-Ditylum_brightwellii.AAC.1
MLGKSPSLGVLDTSQNNLFATKDEAALDRKYLEWVRGVQFELIVPRIRDAYVGNLHESTLHDDLRGCKQTYFDKKLHRMETLTAQQFHE